MLIKYLTDDKVMSFFQYIFPSISCEKIILHLIIIYVIYSKLLSLPEACSNLIVSLIKCFSGNGHFWNRLHLLTIRIYEFLIIFTLLSNNLCVLLTNTFTMCMHVLYFILYTFIFIFINHCNEKPLMQTFVKIL